MSKQAISENDFITIMKEKIKDKYQPNTFISDDLNGRIIYDLISAIDLQSVTLYDTVRSNIFIDLDYDLIEARTPTWLRYAGNSAESSLSKNEFEKLYKSNNNKSTNMLLYTADFDMLIGALQSRYTTIIELLNEIYSIITPNLSIKFDAYKHVGFSRCSDSIKAHSYINSIYIMINSSFDILTKIAIELDHIKELDFNKYPKLKSQNVLFGQRKKVNQQLHQETIFSYPTILREVQSIRDEIIHNGSMDFNNVTYDGYLDGKIYTWIFYPEFDEYGAFTSSINRKKFYDDPNRTFNNILPKTLIEIFRIILKTLAMINKLYHK